VRVVSNHLKSTGITSLDNAYLTHHEYLLDTAREEKLRSIVDRFHKNCVVRADQVDSIRRHIDHEAPALRIICGDFNDTPVSYTYRKLAKGMQDAFSECGSGYSYTFRGFYNLLRIDYVLLSKGLECVAYEVPEVELSDHLPIVVRFEKQTTY
jgi:endonuclease/exonuclease/phosphatase family metal-dependent hydrolase